MRCAKCGKEFGNGVSCQNCGTDRVTGLGNYHGYSTPSEIEQTNLSLSEPIRDTKDLSEPTYISQVVEDKTMVCHYCNEIIPVDSKFCPYCSRELLVTCPKCGYRYSSQYPSCSQCGTNRLKYQEEESNKELIKEKTLKIPYGKRSIKSYEFYNKTFEYVKIPKSVKLIGDWAFQGCKSLKEIVIPNSVTTIGNNAFQECESLNKIVIPDSVTTIGDWAFQGCKSLKEIVIPDSVTTIGDYAFFQCESLEKVVMPSTAMIIGKRAFRSP